MNLSATSASTAARSSASTPIQLDRDRTNTRTDALPLQNQILATERPTSRMWPETGFGIGTTIQPVDGPVENAMSAVHALSRTTSTPMMLVMYPDGARNGTFSFGASPVMAVDDHDSQAPRAATPATSDQIPDRLFVVQDFSRTGPVAIADGDRHIPIESNQSGHGGHH